MHKKYFFFQLLIVILIFGAMVLPVQAAEGVTVTLTPNQNQLAVGDPVELTLNVTHPAGYQVIIPPLEQTWGPFEVWAQSQASTTDHGDGTATTQQTITVTLFELGAFETPPLPLTISDSSGQVTEEIAPPLSLTVNSTLAEGDTALKDIRPQASMQAPFPWLAVVAGLLVLAVVVAGAGWLIRRLRKNGVLGRMVDNRTPFQLAYDELDRIDGLRLPEQGHFKGHYTLVTDALRQYLEQQFRINAFDRTTAELKQSLQTSTLSVEQTRRFVEFFVDSDLVKFAKLIPDLEEAHNITNSARLLVKLTQPIPEPAKTSSQSSGVGPTQKPVEVAQ